MTTAPTQAPLQSPPKRPGPAARVVAWFARFARSLRHGVGPGAILDKELRVQGRRSGTFWVRLAFGLVLSAFVGLALANATTGARVYGSQVSSGLEVVEQFQRSGPAILLTLAWLQFIGMSLAAAIFTAPLICEERRSGTLGTLLTTPLTAWQIVVGKACGALVQLLILGLMGLPVLLAVRVFGGISGEVVLASVTIVSGATIANCALGILASTLSRRLSAAVGSAIAFTLIWYFVPPLIGLLLTQARVAVPWHVLAVFSPGAGMVLLSEEVTSPRVTAGSPSWLFNFSGSMVVAFGAFLVATLRLRAIMREASLGRESPAAGAALTPVDATDLRALTPRERRRVLRRHRAAEQIAKRSRSRIVGDLPVLWREVRQPLSTRRWVAWASSLGVAGLIVWAFIASDDGDVIAPVVAMIGLVASLLTVCGTAAGALGQEREARSWETLLTTPIPALQILLGKLAGVLARVRLIWLFVGLTIVASAIGWGVHPAMLIHTLMIFASMSFFVACVGLLYGSILTRSSVAIVASLGTILAIWMVFPIVSMMCLSMLFNAEERAGQVIGMTNPFVWAVVAFEGSSHNRSQLRFDLLGNSNRSFAQFTMALSVFCGVYIGLGMALILAARRWLSIATLRAG